MVAGADSMLTTQVSPLTWLVKMVKMDSLGYQGPDQLVLYTGRDRMSSAWSVVIRRQAITTTHLPVRAAKVRTKAQ